MNQTNDGIPSILGLLGRLANIGLFMAAALLVGLFLGTTADSLLGIAPWGALAGLALGAAAGLREFVGICRGLSPEPEGSSGTASRSGEALDLPPPGSAPQGADRTNETESEGRNPDT